jgi:hypothetical protein
MENKTAVEWLYETLWKQNDYSLPSAILEQAKKMEKQQIEEAYSNGRVDEQFKGTGASFYITKAEQYYNETFNK